MNEDSEIYIVCSRCHVKISGPTIEAVDTAFRGHEKEAHGYMTGQEFLTRFTQELDSDKHLMTPGAYKHALEIAKRAAGVK